MKDLASKISGAYSSMRESEHRKALDEKTNNKQKIKERFHSTTKQTRWESQTNNKIIKNSFGDITFQTFQIEAKSGAEKDKLKRLNEKNISIAEEINKSLADIALNTKPTTKQNTQIKRDEKSQERLNKNLETIISEAGWGKNGKKGKKGNIGIADSIEKMMKKAGDKSKSGFDSIMGFFVKWKVLFGPLTLKVLGTLGKVLKLVMSGPFKLVNAGWKFMIGIGKFGKATIKGIGGMFALFKNKKILGGIKALLLNPFNYLKAALGKSSKWHLLLVPVISYEVAKFFGVSEDSFKETIAFFRDNFIGAGKSLWVDMSNWWRKYFDKTAWETLKNESQMFFEQLKTDPLKAVWGGAKGLFVVLTNMSVDLLKAVKRSVWTELLKPVVLNIFDKDFTWGGKTMNLAKTMMGDVEYNEYQKTNFTDRRQKDIEYWKYIDIFYVAWETWQLAQAKIKEDPTKTKAIRQVNVKMVKRMKKALNNALDVLPYTTNGSRQGSAKKATIRHLKEILAFVSGDSKKSKADIAKIINHQRNKARAKYKTAVDLREGGYTDVGTYNNVKYDAPRLAKIRAEEVEKDRKMKEEWAKENDIIFKMRYLMKEETKNGLSTKSKAELIRLRGEYKKISGKAYPRTLPEPEKKVKNAYRLWAEGLSKIRRDTDGKIISDDFKVISAKYNKTKKFIKTATAASLGNISTILSSAPNDVKAFLQALGKVESKNNYFQPPNQNGYEGKYQFRYRDKGDLGMVMCRRLGVSPDQVRRSPELQEQMMLLTVQDYDKSIKKNKLPMDNWTRWLYHNQGPGGAAAILSGKLTPGIRRNIKNQSVSGSTDAQLIANYTKKFRPKFDKTYDASSDNLIGSMMAAGSSALSAASGSSMKLAVTKLFAGTGFLAAASKAFGGAGSGVDSFVNGIPKFFGEATEGIKSISDGKTTSDMGGCNIEGKSLENVRPGVIQKLKKLCALTGGKLYINSAYRSPTYNRKIGGASKSYHVKGMALDIHWPNNSDISKQKFLEAVVAAGFTGIGIYPNFIHVDIGPTRQWGGSAYGGSVPAWAMDIINRGRTGKAANFKINNAKISQPAGTVFIPSIGIVPNGSLEMQVIQHNNTQISEQLSELKNNVDSVMASTHSAQDGQLQGIIQIPQN